jgi:repressor LexA
MAITKRQREVYDFIYEFVQKNGYSPSFEEIGNGLGLSSLATVHKHISNLEKKGLLKRDYNRSRSIDVLPVRGLFKRQTPKVTEITLPLMGRIAAGQPIEAVENPETISLGDITRSKDVFVLQVKGESMKDEHIVDGDYVLVEKGNTARDGEIVVALVDGAEATALPRRPEYPSAAFQHGDEAHHGPGQVSSSAGPGDWRASQVLRSPLNDRI